MAKMASFIRWAGGKSWLVPFVQELIEGIDYNNYFEPFMGGASIFFSIHPPHQSFLSDINEELVNTFQAVRDNPQRVILHLKELVPNEETYYQVRKTIPRGRYQKAARFLFLNANSFNGLYRVNLRGEYNVPYGKKDAYVDYVRLKEISQLLKGVQIKCHDFRELRNQIKEGDLVFLDPPYAVSNNEACFIKYHSTLFSIDDQKELGELIDHINKQGAYYILTNAAHPDIEAIFSDRGRIVEVQRVSLIGGKNSFRGKVPEYVFTNIPERK